MSRVLAVPAGLRLPRQVRQLPSLAPVAALGALSWYVTQHYLAGDRLPAIAVGGLLALGVAVRRPRPLVAVLVVAWASVFYRPLQLDVLGVQTDLGEMVAFLLLGTWLLQVSTGAARVPRALLPPAAVLVLAVTTGVLTGLARGGTLHSMLGDVKPLLCYLLFLPLASWYDTVRRREALENLVHLTCVVGSLVALGATLSGIGLSHITTLPESVSAGATTLSGVTRLRPPLTSLLVLATLLLMARVLSQGWTPGRRATLALYALMHALGYTRSTWVPLALALLVLGLRHRGARVPLRGLASVLVALVGLVALFGLASSGALGAQGAAVAARLGTVGSSDVLRESSFQDRLHENRVAWGALQQHPLEGTGLSQPFGLRAPVYVEDPPRFVYRDIMTVHNQYLFLWLQLGLLGLLLPVVLLRAVVRQLRQVHARGDPATSNAALAAGLTLLVFAFQALFQTFLLFPAQILATAVAVALTTPPRGERPARQPEDDAQVRRTASA